MNKRASSFSASEEGWLDRLIQRWRFGVIFPFIGQNKIVCDLGCGKNGDFLFGINNHISLGIGIDGNVSNSKNEKIILKEGNLNLDLPLESDYFDIVVSLAVLEHLNNPQNLISEAKRILKKGGILLLTTPAPCAKGILEILSFFHLISRVEIEDHKHYFSIEELRSLGTEYGFTEVAVKKFQLGFNNLLIVKK